ncbi:MAG: M4 family metallopeptidase [Planctomycetaceae bacterium]|nr:M4 family metallopeptidase [Planctomycetaceae bacterium]
MPRVACRRPIQCIVPPYMVEHMARSADPKLRERAVVDMARSSAVRAVRTFSQQMPALLATASPTGRKHRLVYDARKKDVLPGKLVRAEGDPKTADPCVNEAYDYSGDTFDFFLERFARNSLDDDGMTLISSVHVGEADGRDRFQPMNNAFWDGAQMAYGDGDGEVFQCFTRSLDVVAHELTHGVQAFTSNLAYRGQSGALNEHFADVFGVLVRQWRRKESADEASWLVGAEILVAAKTRRAIRDMEHPGTAYADDPALGSDPQPDHMDRIYTGPADSGGVHLNSGIPNRAFVLCAQSLGGPAWETPGAIWYEALLQLSRTSQFSDMAKLTAQIAGDRFGAATKKAVRAAWKKVGL